MTDNEQPDTDHQFDTGNSPGSPVAGVTCRPKGETYVLKAAGTNLWKIGHTKQTAEERMAALQTGCPHDLECFTSFRTPDPRGLEKALHEHLNGHHLRGEWFEASPRKVCRAILDVVTGGRRPFTSVEAAQVSIDERLPIPRTAGAPKAVREEIELRHAMVNL